VDLHKKVRSHGRLLSAWLHVRSNGTSSQSSTTRQEIEDFEKLAFKEIRSLSGKLSSGSYRFDPEFGYRKKKKGNDWRPVVVGTISNRIVRRAILDVVQETETLKRFFDNPFSFGGIAEKGVSNAVLLAKQAIRDGAKFFITSDIASFFTAIPKDKVFEILDKHIQDKKFLELLRAAVTTELVNLSDLNEDRKRFPLENRGVAQGSCLSPLIGNILLHEFDQVMNSKKAKCYRYIDDFIILGQSTDVVRAAFAEALEILNDLGLTAYKPDDGTKKAVFGQVSESFLYLGTEFTKDQHLRPSRASKNNILDSVSELFEKSLASTVDEQIKSKITLADVTKKAHLICESWRKQYFYCDDEKFFIDMREVLGEKFLIYREEFVDKFLHHATREVQNASLGFSPFK
jgi:RNA-directed DNA polymerase